uniref:Uncharacterized protein n=1 Tax=Anopheles quadriannulatus TaxID=34691 RepID=A0A182X4U6_ANOQN
MTSQEANAKTRKPADSCDGDNKAKEAVSSEGETSANKLSTGEEVPIMIHAAPTTNASKRASTKSTIQAALTRLVKVQHLEREMALKKFELKMANLKFEQEKIRLQFEYERESIRSSVKKTFTEQINCKQLQQQQQQHQPQHHLPQQRQPQQQQPQHQQPQQQQPQQHKQYQQPQQHQQPCDVATNESACIKSGTPSAVAVRDEIVLPELDAEGRRSSEQHNTALLHDASRMWVPREPFGVVSVIPSQHGQQTVDTPDDGSAPALLLSQLARCASVTGKPKPSERSCTGGAARDDSTVRRTNLAISACGNSRQHEFANTRSFKQLPVCRFKNRTVDSTVPERGVEVNDRDSTHRFSGITRDLQHRQLCNREKPFEIDEP